MNQGNGYFLGQKGVKIFWQSWEVDKPSAVVVVCHGLGEHGGRYRHLAETLVAENYSVYAIDHRGHGHSYGHRGKVEDFSYAVADLKLFLDTLLASQLAVPRVLFGHSMGGAISLAYTLSTQQSLAGLMLSGAALSVDKIPGSMRTVCELLAAVAPNLPTANLAPDMLSRDPAMVSDFKADPLNLSAKIPLKTLAELIRVVPSLSERFAELSLPLLILHGEKDQLVPHTVSERVYEKSASEDKTLNIYPGLYHDVVNEGPADRKQVVDDIRDWLNQRFK